MKKRYTLYKQQVCYRKDGWRGALRSQEDEINTQRLNALFEKGFFFKLVDNETKEVVATNAKRGIYGLDLLK